MYTPNILSNSTLLRGFTVSLVLACLGLACGCSGGAFGGTSDTTSNLVIDFSGFGPHIGERFYLKVADTSPLDGPSVIAPRIITSSSFTVTVADALLVDRTYNIDFWVDVDGNGLLDHSPIGNPEGVDHSWRIVRTGLTDDIRLSFVHDTDWTDITPY